MVGRGADSNYKGVSNGKYTNLQFIKDLWSFIKPYKARFIFWSIALSSAYVLGLIPPIITAEIVNFFVSENKGNVSTFYIYLGILLVVMVVGTFVRLKSKNKIGLIQLQIQKDAKTDSFKKLMEGDLVWHDKENTGNKLQRINEGVGSFSSFIDLYSNQIVDSVISLIGVIAVFTFFSIKYALLAFLFMASYLYIEFKFNKKIIKETLKLKIEKEKSSGKAYEFSSNISTVKSLGIEYSLNKRIGKQEERIFNASNNRRRLSNTKWISVQTVASFFYVLFILVVGRDILLGSLTAGVIVVYMAYVSKIKGILNVVSDHTQRLIDIKFGIMRMMEIYRTIPQVYEENALSLGGWNKIQLKNVGFKYKEEEVLENFSLDIRKGENIGIVGRSGSGKSTLFKLLLKLYSPQHGLICFDNKPLSSIKRSSIINKFSIVLQETEVFNFSLKENILISNPGKIDWEMYKKAVRISQLDKVIKKLSNKDQTLIGEKGVRLSGGERQRLGIARAVYRDSDVIILDEATSNLDYETEKKIQGAMSKELGDKTLIISAHRLSTLEGMDKIIVIKHGRIIESGKYHELLKKRGEFYKIWKEQLRTHQ